MKLRLSKVWVKKLLNLPETGMGYQKVDVLLKDGRKIEGVFVYNAEFLELPEAYQGVTINDIVDITLSKINDFGNN